MANEFTKLKVGSTEYIVYDSGAARLSHTQAFSTITDRGEEYLSWGGPNWAGNVSPIGMALSNEHSANRMAFINGDCITAEYSSDAGSTWTAYAENATAKSQFFTTAWGFHIGRPSDSTEYTTNSRTRITITAQDGTNGYVYTDPKKMLINISSSGGMNVLVEYRTGTNYKSGGAWTTYGTYSLSGWSGWNDVPLILDTLGGGTTQTGNNWQLRLTFIMTSKSTAYPTVASVSAVRIYGSNSWTTPSTMASSGHMYTFDMSKNVTFPAQVSATQFNGSLNGNASSASSASNADTLDGYHAASFATASHSHSSLNISGGNEMNLAYGCTSDNVWFNYRGSTATIGNYILGDGKGGMLGNIIHSGNIGSQSVSYASKADKVDNKHATDLMYYGGNVRDIVGSGSPASGAKTYWIDNVPTNMTMTAYNDAGTECTLLFSKGMNNLVGTIFKWSYSDNYLRMLRRVNDWCTDNWEKISAGYADSAGHATTAGSVSGTTLVI